MSVRPPSPTLIVISSAAGSREPYGEFARFIFVRSARMNHHEEWIAWTTMPAVTFVETKTGRRYFETGRALNGERAPRPRGNKPETDRTRRRCLLGIKEWCFILMLHISWTHRRMREDRISPPSPVRFFLLSANTPRVCARARVYNTTSTNRTRYVVPVIIRAADNVASLRR